MNTDIKNFHMGYVDARELGAVIRENLIPMCESSLERCREDFGTGGEDPETIQRVYSYWAKQHAYWETLAEMLMGDDHIVVVAQKGVKSLGWCPSYGDNDPEFEEAIKERRQALLDGFEAEKERKGKRKGKLAE